MSVRSQSAFLRKAGTLRDYVTTFDFLKRAKAIGLTMSELITDKFPLEQINEALQTNLAMTGLKIAVVNK